MKDNLFNRVFHSKELKAQKEKIAESKKLVELGPETLQFITRAKTLNELLQAHKIAWERGYRNENLGPCSYGMFRTKDIANMKPEEVYLGGIWGLWTFNIPEWENNKNEIMVGNGFGINPEIKVYDLIMNQYRTLLRKNIEKIVFNSKKTIREYYESI